MTNRAALSARLGDRSWIHSDVTPGPWESTETGDGQNILSLGAGVQSSTMALMAAHGELDPMPVAAIFADTQAEPGSVYRWLDWLETKLPFPVHRVTAGSLAERSLKMRVAKDGRRFSFTDIPFFARSHDGSIGKIPFRSCTRDFKIKPIIRESRRLAAVKRGEKSVRVIQWIGISTDEIYRMKDSRDAWIEHRWPLIEKRMSRTSCLDWMESHGYPEPPRSACVFCPFHSNREWRRLKDEEPDEFARAVQFERDLQSAKSRSDNFDATPFLHRDATPLDLVDLSTAEERGQMTLWNEECEGMCGV